MIFNINMDTIIFSIWSDRDICEIAKLLLILDGNFQNTRHLPIVVFIFFNVGWIEIPKVNGSRSNKTSDPYSIIDLDLKIITKNTKLPLCFTF